MSLNFWVNLKGENSMLLTKLANKQIANFLRTVTIKNGYFADQLLNTVVLPSFRTNFPDRYNPYYMHMTGQYILQNDITEELTDDLTGEPLYDAEGNVVTRTYSAHLTMQRGDGTSKTYRNLAVYSDYDEMMYITSLDTYKTIAFTRENLHGDPDHPDATVHRKTLEAYKVSGRYFKILCEKYPKQVDLIKSIVYLVPEKELSEDEIESYDGKLPNTYELRLQRVIEAEHLELINYDATLLEERERENIVNTIRGFLAFFKKRWDVKEFTYEEHYANVSWTMLFNLLIGLIKMQRMANIRTPFVHSSHVWSELTSNGLESYKGYLTPEQELFLYKNIRFLRANAGQHMVLNILVDKLLAENHLHLETKTVLQDTTGITVESEVPTKDFSEQCALCSRYGVTCFNKNTQYKCENIVPTKKLFKPEPVILSEELYGAREEKIITRLMTQYDLTEAEARQKFERSFIWKDAQVEDIRLELDRRQVVDLDGSIETLDDLISDEFDCGLEPIYNEDVVDHQTVELQHVKSTVIPTKLIEITEDHKDPKYLEWFQKFFADTLMQFAPARKETTAVSKMLTNYMVDIDQGAVTLSLSFGEAIALLYLNVLQLNKQNIKVSSLVDGEIVEEYVTNFLKENTIDFPIPNQSIPVLAFKLGAPVKQEDVVSSYALATDDDQSKYLSYSTNADENTKVCRIGTAFYYITRTAVARASSSDSYFWDEHGYEYKIVGKLLANGVNDYKYYANADDQIAILPKYFRWHGQKLFIKTVRYKADLDNLELDHVNQLAAVWDKADRGVYKCTDGVWSRLDDESESMRVTFYKVDGNDIRELTAAEQNALNGDDLDEFIAPDGSTSLPDGSPIPELTEYEEFASFFDGTLSEEYTKCVLNNYIDIDWILQNRYFDTLTTISDQLVFGQYLSRMFDLFVRLDVLRCTAGDTKTKNAVITFFEHVLDNRLQKFRLVNINENSRPLYSDWAAVDDDLSAALRHIEHSSSKTDLMEKLNDDLYNALTEGCDSVYNYSPTANTKLNKLMQLVRSLSSYLINFINSGTDAGRSTELSHISTDVCMSKIKFSTFIQEDAVGQVDNLAGIPDLNGNIFFPTDDIYVKENVQYFASVFNSETDETTFELQYGLQVGDVLPVGLYNRVNFHELLELDATDNLRAIYTEQNGWLYWVTDAEGNEGEYQTSPEFSMYMERITRLYRLRTTSSFKTVESYMLLADE